MKRWLSGLLAMVVLVGCGGGSYKVTRQEYRERVRTLAVVPLLIDGGSVVNHPQRAQVMELLRNANVGRTPELVTALQEKRAYFDVREVAGQPERLLEQLAAARIPLADTDGGFRYRFHREAVAELTRVNMADGLLVVVLHGAVRNERQWDRTRLKYLDDSFNVIMAYAAVLLPSGETAWEWRSPVNKAFLSLQYADFDEAAHNRTDKVSTKFLLPEGLERTLTEPGRNLLGRSRLPDPYHRLFSDLSSALRPGLLNPFAPAPAAAP